MVPSALPSNVLRRAAWRVSHRSQHRRLTTASWLMLWVCLLGALALAPRAAEGAAGQAVLDKSSSDLPSAIEVSSITNPISAGDQWMATYGGVLDDSILAVAQTHDGGFVVAGDTVSF